MEKKKKVEIWVSEEDEAGFVNATLYDETGQCRYIYAPFEKIREKIRNLRRSATVRIKEEKEKMKRVANLTPHPIRVRLANGREVIFEPSGIVPRLATKEVEDWDVNGIPVFKREFGEVENLPEPREDTVYIVSSLVKQAVPNRDDLLVPDTGKSCIRDENGNIVAVTRFVR